MIKLKNFTNSNKGFTIMETMVALSLLGVGMMAMTAMQIKSMSSTTTSEIITQSSIKGLDIYEKLVAKSYDNITSDSTTEDIYTVKWDVSAADTPIPNTKTITITMQTTRGGTRNEELSFVYYKSDKF